MTWLTGEDTDVDEAGLPRVLAYWPNADEVDADVLVTLLASARVQCAAFAPNLAVEQDPPTNYLHAQALQARALYNAGITGPNDQAGLEGFSVTVFPMDWTVKALLRPKRGKPAIA